jgi:DNA polymerase-3 subunit beta
MRIVNFKDKSFIVGELALKEGHSPHKFLNSSAEDIDYSNEARERLACSYEGESMEIGFNSKFLQEMLNNIDNEMITIEMSQPNRAGILFPVDNDNKSEDVLMLVMPVMLNQ